MSLGLFLIAGIITFFAQSSKIYYAQSELDLLYSNGRFAIELLKADIQKAGFLGCVSRWSERAVLNTLNNPTNFKWDFYNALHGNENITDNQWNPTLDTSISKILRGDVLTLRYADSISFKVLSHRSIDDPLVIERTTTLEKGDIVGVADCDGVSILQITSTRSSKARGTTTIYHTLTSAYLPGNQQESLYKIYDNHAQLRALFSVSYYIRQNGSGQPALYRIEGDGVAREMIAGIEDMQIKYGIDNNMDNQADEYLTADKVATNNAWHKIMIIQLSLLTRSLNEQVTQRKQNYTYNGVTVTAEDSYFRRVISADISLRNRIP